ncbi:Gfa-like protein [Candidatus Rhodobacter oscarellae]|uniref:Gfa-like protein n=1 Tax=Candidatus Rhodobacter oscarellae TaxID=1675527 RepID=A0A0J9EA93_9RHOB|nr:GFA family protein [Candidatus Rhodobacter lobularis]KMW59700.1 Gfa-like protein [Candidatus Rhodobacter lobularis]
MKGQCMCGAVTVTAELARDNLTACHCEMCRRWCSGPFVAVEAKPGAKITGPAKVVQTSDWAERAHCAECGSGLWYRMTDPAGPHRFAAGLFDTGEMPIALEVWIDQKPAGYAFAGERRQMTGAEIVAFFTGPSDGAGR